MKCNDLDKIILHKSFKNKQALINDEWTSRTKTPKYTAGLDTETYLGGVSLICAYGDVINDHMIVYENTKIEELLKWLTRDELRNSHNFFFNTAFDKDAILKLLPYKKIEELIRNNILYYKGYKIQLIGNRVFDVAKVTRRKEKLATRYQSHFADITSFYNKYGGLENTVTKVLKKTYKKSIDIQRGCLFETDGTCYIHTFTDDLIEVDPEEIIQYCYDDSQYTYEQSKNITSLAEGFFKVRRYFSPATLSKAFYKQQMPNYCFSKWNTIQKIHFKSYGGGRFEIMQKGFFPGDDKKERIRMADINSAYPYHMNQLSYPRGTHYKKAEYEPDSIYSGYVVDIEMLGDHVMSPLRKLFKNLWVYPTGKAKNINICKTELELLMEEDCRIKIKEGYHIKTKEPDPWVEGIQEIYNKRKEDPNDKSNHIRKLWLNSLYGCTCEITKKPLEYGTWTPEEESDPENSKIAFEDTPILLKNDYYCGKYFNPIIAAETTARTRAQIYRDFKKREDDIVMIATDSVALKGKMPVKNSQKLGGWEYYPELEGFVMASGIYSWRGYKKKDKDFIMTKNRGVIYDIAKNERIDLEKLFRGCMESELKLVKTRPKSLKEALPKKYHDMTSEEKLKKINIFLPYEKTFNPNIDKKRNWHGRFKNFNEILERQITSEPLLF